MMFIFRYRGEWAIEGRGELPREVAEGIVDHVMGPGDVVDPDGERGGAMAQGMGCVGKGL